MEQMSLAVIVAWQLVSVCFVALSAFGFVVLVALQ